MRPSYTIFDRDTKAFVYGYQTNAIQRMLDFDYICKRERPSIAAIINPSRAGIHKRQVGCGDEQINIAYPQPFELENFFGDLFHGQSS